MIGYDNWKSYNYRDNDLGSIQDDEPIEEEDDVDDTTAEKAEANLQKTIKLIKECNEPSDLETELALTVIARQFPNSAMILRLRLGTPFDRDLDVPYRDVKFNESTRDGKGW